MIFGNYPVGTSGDGLSQGAAIEHSRRFQEALERRAHSRKLAEANAILKPDHNVLSMWWAHSILRKVAQELGNFPRRILAIRCLPTWALYRLPQTPAGLPANSFLQSCSDYIRAQRGEFRWVGYLDAQILGAAYDEGARWAYGIGGSCNQTRKGSSARLISFLND